MIRKLLMPALLASAAAAIVVTPATAKPPAANGVISFTRFDPALGGEWRIWSMRADGRAPAELVHVESVSGPGLGFPSVALLGPGIAGMHVQCAPVRRGVCDFLKFRLSRAFGNPAVPATCWSFPSSPRSGTP